MIYSAFMTTFLSELLDTNVRTERSNPGQFTRWGIIGKQLVYCFISVGLTGCLLEDDLKVFADAGVAEVIEKPLSFDKLRALLNTCSPSK